jgi:polyisoprenyl-phosphate glycosyltransferase
MDNGCAVPALSWNTIFVNDGSLHGTAELLDVEGAADPRIRAIQFSSYFGHQAEVTAGLDFADGAIVVKDADMQDPPAPLPEMIAGISKVTRSFVKLR